MLAHERQQGLGVYIEVLTFPLKQQTLLDFSFPFFF